MAERAFEFDADCVTVRYLPDREVPPQPHNPGMPGSIPAKHLYTLVK